jgi:hypothetical protein
MKPTDSANQGSEGFSRYDDGVPHHQPGVHDEWHNLDVAHEHIDVNLRGLAMSVVAIIVVVIVSQVLMYVLFQWFVEEAEENDPVVSPLAAQPAQMPNTTTGSPYFSVGAQGPRLLTDEPMALEELRAEEQKRLQSYGWIDEKSGIAHIPIEEAKRLILERGLPAREGAATPHFTVPPPARGEASGGRTITAPPPEPTAAAPPTPKSGAH